MRNTNGWYKDLEKEFARYWHSPLQLSPSELCKVELGLRLLESIAPKEPALSLWAVLTGFPFLLLESAEARHKLFNARQLLQRFKSRHLWLETLNRYRELNGGLRGYDLDNKNHFKRREVAICRNRFNRYDETLTSTIAFLQKRIKLAEAGSYRTADRHGNDYGLNLPSEACFEPLKTRHELIPPHQKEPITVKWLDLVETARWMDRIEVEQSVAKNSWEHRLVRGDGQGMSGGVQVEIFNHKNKLVPASEIRLEGLTHFVGMVSSGKSTLMEVLAVWAAKRGLHVTLVVGDVIGALDRAQRFHNLGLNAVPVLGSTQRPRHINSLHKVLQARRRDSLLVEEHIGFRWLSTACPLDGLRRDDNPAPFPPDFRPCADLRPVQINNGKATGPMYCPLYSKCPYHQAQRDLVEAQIWIATPASLVHTRVAEQINTESLRFAELVVRRSDLVIVDEADRVQVQLDEIFSPSQTLCSATGDGWLDDLEQQVGEHTGKRGRVSVAGEEIEIWRRAYHQAQTAADAVYNRLLGSGKLRDWIYDLYFFTDVLIFDHLAKDIADDPDKQTPLYKKLRKEFDDFIDKGLRDLFNDRLLEDEPLSVAAMTLANFANRLLLSSDSRLLRHELRKWIDTNSNFKRDENKSEQMVEQLEFAMLIAVLGNRLNVLLGRWKEVEETLGLERSSSTLLYRPPLDYQALLPTTPVGNVLAFQYLHDEASGASTLKFLRCTGVGRFLLLHLHDLLSGEGILGPNVLMLSGTSWAGRDPSYHLQAPVSGILRAPQKEIAAIAQSEFKFLPLRDAKDRAITVSGRYGDDRADALRQMLRKLARTTGIGANKSSLLETERDALTENRRRILLVVGSYKEAEISREYLERERPDWRDNNEVIQLIPDTEAYPGESDLDSKLPRGQVDQFAATEAWLLIAPLMAIERGHNILNEERVAAIGAAYFLVRPHPRPQDLSYAVRSLNKWAMDEIALLPEKVKKYSTYDAAGQAWRREANHRWRELLTTGLIHSNLPKAERDLLTWSLMVSIWQVIGRLIRGGQPASIYFCDAKFDPVRAGLAKKSISLLDEMKLVLQPYVSANSGKAEERDRVLVEELYGPLYQALQRMQD
jgi:restriction endonuclease in pPIWI_RE module